MKQNDKPLRILVLTLAPWNYKNCTGSTQSSIFEGMENIQVANIYCRYGNPDNAIVSRYFQITEKSMLNHLLHNKPSGYERFFDKSKKIPSNTDVLNDGENKIFNWMRILRFQIFYWAQELFWKLGLWKSKELDTFVKDFDPDILWIPIYYTCYTNNLALYLKKLTNKNMACYISDDNYTMHQFSLSPFYWIDRLIKRPKIKKVIKECSQLYVITEKQKQEYDDNYTMHQFSLSPFYWIDRLIKRPKIKKVIKECSQLYVITEKQKQEYDDIFNINSKVLTKGANFKNEIIVPQVHDPIRLVYMGSLGFNRWKSLAKFSSTLAKLKDEGINAFLSIYTMTPLTDKIRNKLEIENVSKIQPTISNEEIDPTFQNNDILIHVEPTDLKNTLYYRLSFSTKLVDYFRNGRCIIAYGGNTGSMDYLSSNDCGIVINHKDDLYQKLKEILTNPRLIKEYSHKCYEIGVRNHQIEKIQTSLRNDLSNLANNEQ